MSGFEWVSGWSDEYVGEWVGSRMDGWLGG